MEVEEAVQPLNVAPSTLIEAVALSMPRPLSD
jgi:hypothetical protein